MCKPISGLDIPLSVFVLIFVAFGLSCKKKNTGSPVAASADSCYNFPPISNGLGYTYKEATRNWEGAVFNPNNSNQIAYIIDKNNVYAGVYVTNVTNTGDTIRIAGNTLISPKWNKNGWILLGSLGGWLYKVKQNGDSLREFNTFTSVNFNPDWSPDGKRVVFSGEDGPRYAGLFIMNSNGSGETTLDSLHGSNPIWSPDGTKIAFSTDAYIGYLDTLSQHITIIKYLNGDAVGSMSWFPDSKWIIYSANSGLSKININSGQEVNLRPNCESRGYGSPYISSDGSKIIVTRINAQITHIDTINYVRTIWIMNVDGTNERKVNLK